jgi:hypothetical protein
VGLRDRLRWAQPTAIRRVRGLMLDCQRLVRRLGADRGEPQFLIVGAQRSGTTSLYRYLSLHPSIAPPIVKETQFFSSSAFHNGPGWYRANFPTRRELERLATASGQALTFEATPYYLFHPLAARRVASSLPQVKIIVLLRNPVDRAFSHYLHSMQRRIEPLSFEDALAAEPRRLAGQVERMLGDERYDSHTHRAFSYFARGLYADQLAEWHSRFSRDAFLVLESEALYRDPSGVYRQVVEWLGLASWEPPSFDAYERSAPDRPMLSSETRLELERRYAPHNERLCALVGREFSWAR